MASSVWPKNIDSKLQMEWYKIRDMLFGCNYVCQIIPFAIKRAMYCNHPDARWLTDVCAGKNVTTKEDAKRLFSGLGQNDARALCFAWLLGDQKDLAPLRRSAELGFAFAQAWITQVTESEKSFEFALLAVSQGERDGFFRLGCCLSRGFGSEQNFDEAKKNYVIASKLGHVLAMIELGDLLDASDPQRWQLWGRAETYGASSDFLPNFAKQVELFNSGYGSAAVMFAIGQALQGQVNEQAKTIFNTTYKFNACISSAKQAIAFYEAQIKATKDAMRAWTQVGIRLHVVKDIRKLIAALIWDSREEALYFQVTKILVLPFK